MEDSKIRGVGEILGEKQHGAVETFGYNLYMKMLNEEILKLKGEVEEELDEVDVELNFPRFLPGARRQRFRGNRGGRAALPIPESENWRRCNF